MLSATMSTGQDSSTIVDRDELERAFARLSMDHRVVIAMRFLLDQSPEEIGETLGLSRRTVYSRLKRAVHAMRAAVEADSRLPPTAYGHPETSR
jgi:RNA polymerase sigma factor (sigma-70 family)